MDTNCELKNFCVNIRFLRMLYKLSQREMAQILGIGVKSLRKIEAGEVPPLLSVDVLVAACNHFGISISSMFDPLLGLEEHLSKLKDEIV